MNKFDRDINEIKILTRWLQVLCEHPQPGLTTWNQQFSAVCSRLCHKLAETKGD